jgi:hypothetical protein
MKILLIDFDSKIPNLALMKLSAWHKSQGNEIGFDVQDPEVVSVSVIFTTNKAQAAGLRTMFPNANVEYGGSGWDLKSFLPIYIERIKPDYDLYPSTYSQGFTTRGCVRKCEFCVVPEKEGKIHINQHPSEFHDDRFNTCMIMDNNLLGLRDWFKVVADWFIESKVKMKSPQGWDARLLTEESAGILKDIKHEGGLHFAWDNIKDEEKIVSSVKLLKDAGFNLKHDISYFVLSGFNTTFEQDLYRCNKLKELGVNSFVMPYHKKDKRINNLARWANRRWLYWSIPFEDYKK